MNIFDRTCLEEVSLRLQFVVLSCAIQAQKLEHVSTKMFWRRNKLMSYSMIIDIYYPIELNWIEYFWSSFNFLTTFSKTSNINKWGCKLLQYFKYPPPSLHAKCVFYSSNLAFFVYHENKRIYLQFASCTHKRAIDLLLTASS